MEGVSMTQTRLKLMIESLDEKGLDAFLVTCEPNILYYAGTISGGILIFSSDSEPLLLAPRLNLTVARDQATALEVKPYTRENMLDQVIKICKELKPRKIGFDELSLTMYQELEKKLEKTELKSETSLIWDMRTVKDDEEKKKMEKAAALADVGMEAIRNFLEKGVREHEVAAKASHAMRMEGAEDQSFPFIVASGPRSAYPHAGVTDRKIKGGDFVTVDMGAKYHHYCADLTRTFIVGSPSEKQVEIYETVMNANAKAFPEIVKEAKCVEVDKIARNHIEKKGYGEYFIHSLGHGVGLEVHEPPSLSKTSKDVLAKGNIVTDEPGIYIPGFGGVRIEDTVLVTDSKPKSLTKFKRDLETARV
jgi:Xaa-Pro dipeptidase